MSNYGRLILMQGESPQQEYELSKSSVTLGRAMTNDIILGESRVSREHARIACGVEGCRVIDLNSSNGTRVNGRSADNQLLKSGDLLTLASSTLRFQATSIEEEPEVTLIDDYAELENSIAREAVPMVLNDVTHPQLVVFTAERTWEVPLENLEQVTIGRDMDNSLVLEQARVSRHHARVTRIGGGFSLRDLGSTNGSWLGGEQIEEVILQDGDAVKIGEATVVYKSGFTPAAMTVVAEQLAAKNDKAPVVFVPGMMGSELWLGSQRVWPNIKTFFSDFEVMKYSPDTQLEPRGIVDQVVIVPNLIKQDQYNRLGDYMVEDLGYTRGQDFFEFAYDWRQDVRISARQLGELVEALPVNQPVVIIAHSLGTMVSRYYIERLGGKNRIQRVILMGGPHRGVPKAMTSMLSGPDLLPFGLMGEKMRQIIMTFPSSYQILPVYACAADQSGREINFMKEDGWLAESYRPLLQMGRDFRRELGSETSIPAISIFGYGLKTVSSFVLQLQEQGLLNKLNINHENRGDSTVPQTSAMLDGTEIHPVRQYHGSLFVDQDVKMRLKVELTKTL